MKCVPNSNKHSKLFVSKIYHFRERERSYRHENLSNSQVAAMKCQISAGTKLYFINRWHSNTQYAISIKLPVRKLFPAIRRISKKILFFHVAVVVFSDKLWHFHFLFVCCTFFFASIHVQVHAKHSHKEGLELVWFDCWWMAGKRVNDKQKKKKKSSEKPNFDEMPARKKVRHVFEFMMTLWKQCTIQNKRRQYVHT